MLSECFLEGYQAGADKNIYYGIELDSFAPGEGKEQYGWLYRQAKPNSRQTWENFWPKHGMPMEWVAY